AVGAFGGSPFPSAVVAELRRRLPQVPGSGLTADGVRGWVRTRMVDFAVPRFVRLLEEIPRNATGKIDKPGLRHRAERADCFNPA
ncbi:MAG: hypothetical protein ABIS47_09800, partial [Acidimicrobiales bacterium]